MGPILGISGTKETTLKIDNKKVIVNTPEITFSPIKQHPFEGLNMKKLKNTKKKIKIISLCLNGDMLPEWIKNNKNKYTSQNGQKLENIQKGEQILKEVLQEFLNLNIGCQTEGEKTRESWFDRITDKKDSGGAIYIELKNKKYLNDLKSLNKEQINYQRGCRNKSVAKIFCKLEGTFKDLWKTNAQKIIEEKIWKVLKEFMIGWNELGKVTWNKRGKIGIFELEKQDGKIKEKIQIEYDGGYTEFEIGEWWFKTGLSKRGRKEILKELENKNKNEWTNKIKFMIGRNKANIEDFFKSWLWNELEKEFSEDLDSYCGIWNKGISCPEGGLIYEK
ncbi:hypothetical protein [Mycoplasma parvum]|uniref:Uncharacterized protein n=1 Tax=Mycoplasma parvum str. Indiana TaxID=1403316 RepID=U5NG21_9MOLU|nr:hypothetical protein [Mycoplasma parvum]AGX89134.1 hypothetical protein PRV_01980 [Mycoplasma parvum str. Indiana]